MPAAELESIRAVVSAWKGDERVRSRVLDSIGGFMSKSSVAAFLRKLVRRKVIEQRHEDAWKKVRNSVMHGNRVCRGQRKKKMRESLRLQRWCTVLRARLQALALQRRWGILLGPVQRRARNRYENGRPY